MRSSAILCFALFALPASGAAADAGAGLQQFLDQTQSLTAVFEQEVRSAKGELLSAGRGDMRLLRPKYLRWNYAKPEPLVLASDGRNFWSYDPLLRQSTVVRLEEALLEPPLAVLIGDRVLKDLFRIESGGSREGVDWTRLQSRPDATVNPIELMIGLRGGVLSHLRFVDQFGQEVSLRFTQVRVNLPLRPETFAYEPPQGTDILGIPIR